MWTKLRGEDLPRAQQTLQSGTLMLFFIQRLRTAQKCGDNINDTNKSSSNTRGEFSIVDVWYP